MTIKILQTYIHTYVYNHVYISHKSGGVGGYRWRHLFENEFIDVIFMVVLVK